MNAAQEVKNHLANLSDEDLKTILLEYKEFHEGLPLALTSSYRQIAEYICRKVGVQFNLQVANNFIIDELVSRYVIEG